MRSSMWIGKKGIRYWYYRYRDSEYYALGMIGLTIVVSLLLLFFVIIPEVGQWFSIRDEISATQKRIAVLQANIAFLTNLDKNTVTSQLQIASQALPPDKNFGTILDTIANAAVSSGISLSDYSFPVGNVSKSSATDTTNSTGVSTLTVTITVDGTVDQLSKFIKAIETSLPLAHVTSIDGNNGTTAVTIDFYQKPFPPVDSSGDTPLTPLSEEKKTLLQKLSTWGNATKVTPTQSDSSGSAVPLF